MAKDYNLQVRLTQAEERAHDSAAEASGTAAPCWIRDRLRRAVREELQSWCFKVPLIEPQAGA